MSSDYERAWKPRIYRAWNQRTGTFYWVVTAPRANAWTGMTLSAARTLEREARWFAGTLNACSRGRPAPRDPSQRAVEAV